MDSKFKQKVENFVKIPYNCIYLENKTLWGEEMDYKKNINKTKEKDKIDIEDTIELSISGVLDEMENINEGEVKESENIKSKRKNTSKKILVAVTIIIVIILSTVVAMGMLGKDKAVGKNKQEKKLVSNIDKNEEEITDVDEDTKEESKEEEKEVEQEEEKKEVTESKVENNNNQTEVKNDKVVENKGQEVVAKTEVNKSSESSVGTEKVDTTVMPQGENFLSEVENIVYQKINEERNKVGIQNLINSERIKKYARIKVKDMADNGYMASKDLNGNLITVYMKNDGITYGSWGENIGYVTYNSDPTALAEKFINNFMNSTSSKDKILSTTYSEVGIGIYKSGDRVYIAQEFIR